MTPQITASLGDSSRPAVEHGELCVSQPYPNGKVSSLSNPNCGERLILKTQYAPCKSQCPRSTCKRLEHHFTGIATPGQIKAQKPPGRSAFACLTRLFIRQWPVDGSSLSPLANTCSRQAVERLSGRRWHCQRDDWRSEWIVGQSSMLSSMTTL